MTKTKLTPKDLKEKMLNYIVLIERCFCEKGLHELETASWGSWEGFELVFEGEGSVWACAHVPSRLGQRG